jgi:redox-sensitive bicupin YhaK (pirin superfamily)
MMDAKKDGTIFQTVPLGFQWPTVDPFLFCVHHDDDYPPGNDAMGPAASLAGRNLGMDFEGKDGWRMYHGDVVPGFPQHPHRGFETITIARRGFIDHSDSLGAKARFGRGDVQWMTAGRGVVHSEMFPLLDSAQKNPVELFQIWLNLPKKNKLAPPHFTMLWSETIPTQVHTDSAGRTTQLRVIAGVTPDGRRPPAPPPDSYAQNVDSDLAVWTLAMSPKASLTMPATASTTVRALYFFAGRSCTIAGRTIRGHQAIFARGDAELTVENGDDDAEFLLLQARPLDEPVAQHGPFVMNTAAEVRQAFFDYERTRFGGWRWPSHGPVHPRDQGRFAQHTDGRREEPAEPHSPQSEPVDR